MTAKVVNTSKGRTCDIYIGRGTIYGNPFIRGRDGERAAVIAKFRSYASERLQTDPAFRDAVRALAGKRLGCHCAPKACHGDWYVETLAQMGL